MSKPSLPELCLTTVQKAKPNKYFQPYFENNWFLFIGKVCCFIMEKRSMFKLKVKEWFDKLAQNPVQQSGHFALRELDLDWDKFYSWLQQGTYAGIQSWILQTGSGGKLKALTTLRDQVLGYLGKHEVGFNKQLWLIWQFTATEGWGFPSSLLPCFPTSLTFPIPSSHWLWHSLAFQLTNLTEKDLLRCCCCCCIGFSARLVSPSSSQQRRQHLHKDRTSSG